MDRAQKAKYVLLRLVEEEDFNTKDIMDLSEEAAVASAVVHLEARISHYKNEVKTYQNALEDLQGSDEEDFDPENIYASPSIRQSVEEDRR